MVEIAARRKPLLFILFSARWLFCESDCYFFFFHELTPHGALCGISQPLVASRYEWLGLIKLFSLLLFCIGKVLNILSVPISCHKLSFAFLLETRKVLLLYCYSPNSVVKTVGSV
jgi:hypothetical protein